MEIAPGLRMENQLAIVRDRLLDCDRSSLPRIAWIKAFVPGCLIFIGWTIDRRRC